MYCRRATCYLQILKYSQAIADFKKVVKLEPKNDLVKTQLASTQKLVRKIEFEKVRSGELSPVSCGTYVRTKAIEFEGEKEATARCLEIIAEGLHHI
jgi:serine/threonine-protein phosphatase 5